MLIAIVAGILICAVGAVIYMNKQLPANTINEIGSIMPAEKVILYAEMPELISKYRQLKSENSLAKMLSYDSIKTVMDPQDISEIEADAFFQFISDPENQDQYLSGEAVLALYGDMAAGEGGKPDVDAYLILRSNLDMKAKSAVALMKKVESEDMLIETYKDTTYHHLLLDDADLPDAFKSADAELGVYVFTYENCFFVATSLDGVKRIVDANEEAASVEKLSESDLYKNMMAKRSNEDLIAQGWFTNTMVNVTQSYQVFSEQEKLVMVRDTSLSVSIDKEANQEVFEYFHPENLISVASGVLDPEAIDLMLAEVAKNMPPGTNADPIKEYSNSEFAKFLKTYWDCGFSVNFNIDASQSLMMQAQMGDLSFVLAHLMVPLKDDSKNVLSDLKKLVDAESPEPVNLILNQDQTELVYTEDQLGKLTMKYDDSKEQLIAYFGDRSEAGSAEESSIQADLDAVYEKYVGKGDPQVYSGLNGDQLNSLIGVIVPPMTMMVQDKKMLGQIKYAVDVLGTIKYVGTAASFEDKSDQTLAHEVHMIQTGQSK